MGPHHELVNNTASGCRSDCEAEDGSRQAGTNPHAKSGAPTSRDPPTQSTPRKKNDPMRAVAKIATLMAALTALFLIAGQTLGGETGMIMAGVFAGLLNLGAYWFSDRVVLRMYRARKLGRTEAPELYDLVDHLRQRAGLPMPQVAIAPTRQPNAFATGRSPRRGVVCVTRGLLEIMTREELAAVIAHELAHIKHRDMLVSTVAATLAGALASLARFAIFFGDRSRNPVALIATMILAPLAAAILQMAISRAAEFRADRTAAHILGAPRPMIQALRRLEEGAKRTPLQVNEAAASLAIVNPLGGAGGRGWRTLLRTHPPIEDRIRALETMRS